HTVDSEADYLAYIARLNEVPRFFGQLLEHARTAEAAGILPPRFALEAVAQPSRALVTGAPYSAGPDSALTGDLQRKADALVAAGTVTQARADELKVQARTALVDSVQPAYAQIIAWADAAAPKALANPAGVGTTQAGHNGAE